MGPILEQPQQLTAAVSQHVLQWAFQQARLQCQCNLNADFTVIIRSRREMPVDRHVAERFVVARDKDAFAVFEPCCGVEAQVQRACPELLFDQ